VPKKLTITLNQRLRGSAESKTGDSSDSVRVPPREREILSSPRSDIHLRSSIIENKTAVFHKKRRFRALS
jgi:hypothetical protein